MKQSHENPANSKNKRKCDKIPANSKGTLSEIKAKKNQGNKMKSKKFQQKNKNTSV